MLLYCIRHGESTHNAEKRVQGQSDVPLSAFGRRQGNALAAALAARPIEAVYSSPLRRAWETAEAIAYRHGFEVIADRRLMEIHIGIFQDRLREDLERLYPAELARWHSEDPEYVVPGGESRRALADRGQAAFMDIARSGHREVVVVSHGRLLVTTLKRLLGISHDQPPYAVQNAAITRIELDGDGTTRLLGFDEVDHLAGVGLAGSGDL